MISKSQFAQKIRLNEKWLALDLYPDEIFLGQLKEFLEDGNPVEIEIAPGDEHYRNGVYWYWLRRPGEIDLEIFRSLAELDRDPPLRRETLKLIHRLTLKTPQ